MKDATPCARCGYFLPAGTPGRECPACQGEQLLQPPVQEAFPTVRGYVLETRLAEGGFGTVYIASRAGRPEEDLVALKVLQERWCQDPEALTRFRREIAVVRRLKHEHIVSVYDDGDTAEGRPFYVMPLIDGGTLADRLKDRPALKPLVRILSEVAEAVAYAHARGVLHLDLSPRNILLDADGRPLVTDFGCARLLERRPSPLAALTVAGNPHWAPEQARGEAVFRSDVWAFGVLLHLILTRRPPPRALSDPEVAPRPLDLPAARPTRDLAAICRRCLQRRLEDRYETAAELQRDLERFLQGHPVSARPVGPLGRYWYWWRRAPFRATAAALGAALGLALLSGVVWLDVEHRQARAAEQARRDAEEVAQVAADADAAFRRARWDAALAGYDEAIRRGHPDRPRLEVARLRCLFATNRLEELQAALVRLEGDPGMADRRADLLLQRAELNLCRQDQREKGLGQAREALAATPPLGEADAEYARGLLADGPPAAAEHFRRALRADPFHHRSHVALLAGWSLLGYRPEAATQAAQFRLLFPDDPLPTLLEALYELSRGRKREGLARLDALAPALGPRFAPVREFAGRFADAIAAVNERPGGGPKAPEAVRFIGGGADGLTQPLALPVPAVSWLFELGQTLLKSFPVSLGAGGDEALAELERALKRHPDAALINLAALARVVRSGRHYQGKNLRAAVRDLEEALRLAERALAAPCAFAGPFHYQSRALAALAATMLEREEFKAPADPARRQRLRHHLRLLVSEGEADPGERRRALDMLLSALQDRPARALLLDWAEAAPTDPVPFELLANLELRLGNYRQAIEEAKAAGRAAPRDARLQKRVEDLCCEAKEALHNHPAHP